MAGTTAMALVPVFFGLTLGYLAGRRGIVDGGNVVGLNPFLMSYAVRGQRANAVHHRSTASAHQVSG